MEIVKKCEWCHKTFIGQMVTARFCSSKCCDQAYRYKRKVQSGKYASVGGDTEMSTLPRRVDERKLRREYLKDKQFLSPTEAAKLLGVSRSTIYNYLGLQILKAKQFRGKTIIRRSDIDKLFDEAPSYKKRGTNHKGKDTLNGYYSLKEMMEKFKISKRTVYRRCEQYDIPTIAVSYRGGHNRVHGSHYAHMHKPAVHHHAPAVHHHAPAPHHPKAPVKVDKRHGITNHTLANSTPRHGHSNAGHFGRR